jgi:predicted DNA-binding ribbon-helix-helix protein
MNGRDPGFLSRTLAKMGDTQGRDVNVIRTIRVHGRRTSARLATEIWDMFDEICKQEDITPEELANHAQNSRRTGETLTSSLRRLIWNYMEVLADHSLKSSAGTGKHIGKNTGEHENTGEHSADATGDVQNFPAAIAMINVA